eukprot:TRINITY_DN7348_c0_g1_i1.p1 TRINITY_DN7348_c0_g1~~TRINITY_DN7348_c0_g1_i1.p1  ORF type:complete len:1005 (+),score=220.10 TRINITY_DN7348_c0_g1_i1:209-3223(+)
MLKSPLTAESVAQHLRSNQFISAKIIGEYLGKGKDFNQEVLTAYVKTFDFTSRSFIDIFRDYFESFRPVGEAAVIDRYLDSFCAVFLELSPHAGQFADHDSAFTFLYAVIMLNVDLHSPTLADRKKMTLKGFKRNTEELNDGEDFPVELIEGIYDEVKNDEIKIHREHLERGELTTSSWRHLRDSVHAPPKAETPWHWKWVSVRNTAVAATLDTLLFEQVWRPSLIIVHNVFAATNEGEVLESCLSLFQILSLTSSRFALTQPFDEMIELLCKLSTLSTLSSELFAVHFGSQDKVNYVTVALFTLARKHGDLLRRSWGPLVDCLSRLHELSLLPNVITFEDPFEVKVEVAQPNGRHSPSFYGLFSPSSWFGSSASPSGTDDSGTNVGSIGEGVSTSGDIIGQKFIENAHKTFQQCKFPDLILQSSKLSDSSLLELIDTLLSKAVVVAPEDPNPSPTSLPSDSVGEATSTSSTFLSPSSAIPALPQTPVTPTSSAFALELLTEITLLNKGRVSLFFSRVLAHLLQLCTTSGSNIGFLQKAVLSLMLMSLHLLEVDEIRTPLLQAVQVITKFQINNKVQQQLFLRRKIAEGIREFLIVNLQHFRGGDWTVVTHLLRYLSRSAYSVRHCLSVLAVLCLGGAGELGVDVVGDVSFTYLCSDNYSFVLEILSKLLFVGGGNASGTTSSSKRNDLKGISIRSVALLHQIIHLIPVIVARERHDVAALSLGEDGQQGSEVYRKYYRPVLNTLVSACVGSRRSRSRANSDNSHSSSAPSTPSRTHRHNQRVGTSQGEVGIRHQSLSHLQRGLTTESIGLLESNDWFAVFDEIIFPLVEKVLETPSISVEMIEEERLRASSILCKTFLSSLSKISTLPQFEQMWFRMVSLVQLYVSKADSELLAEAMKEALKNILFVLQKPPSSSPSSSAPSLSVSGSINSSVLSEDSWARTWPLIFSIFPELRALFTPAPVSTKTVASSDSTSPTPSPSTPSPPPSSVSPTPTSHPDAPVLT